jgi:hypothetical protein
VGHRVDGGFALLLWGLDGQRIAAGSDARVGTALYGSGTTFFTLGLGDVLPHTGLGRLLVVLEAGLVTIMFDLRSYGWHLIFSALFFLLSPYPPIRERLRILGVMYWSMPFHSIIRWGTMTPTTTLNAHDDKKQNQGHTESFHGTVLLAVK